MRNIKFVSIFAACGFVLSFVFGLFSHSSFLIILLKAVIFATVFFGLGFLVTFIFNKFLADSSSSLDFNSEDFSDSSQKNSGEEPKLGQLVDVVVEDEELAPSESDNHFLVGDNHQMLKNTDIKESSGASGVVDSVSTDRSKEFVPLRESENVDNFSSKEPVSPIEVRSETSDEVTSDEEDDIDTLPDMENFVVSEDSDSGGDDGNSYNDSSVVSSANTYKKSDGSVPDVKDAALIAKAISTAIAEDDS